MEPSPQQEPQKKPRKRSRKGDGKFEGNTSPAVDDAWEATDLQEVVSEKTVTYKITPKVSGISDNTAGKYGQKSKIRPGFGSCKTTFH